MELIDKAKVVAEIERRAKFFLEQSKNRPGSDDISCSTALYGLLSFFENLETKEVDLDNELDFVKDAYYYFTSDERSSMKKVAKHFFELGMATSNKV